MSYLPHPHNVHISSSRGRRRRSRCIHYYLLAPKAPVAASLPKNIQVIEVLLTFGKQERHKNFSYWLSKSVKSARERRRERRRHYAGTRGTRIKSREREKPPFNNTCQRAHQRKTKDENNNNKRKKKNMYHSFHFRPKPIFIFSCYTISCSSCLTDSCFYCDKSILCVFCS